MSDVTGSQGLAETEVKPSATQHTRGPWVGFSDQGKTVAIMPAGRGGDICTFRVPPSEADANVMIAAPDLLEALKAMRDWVVSLPPTMKISRFDSRAGMAAYSKARAAIGKAGGS